MHADRMVRLPCECTYRIQCLVNRLERRVRGDLDARCPSCGFLILKPWMLNVIDEQKRLRAKNLIGDDRSCIICREEYRYVRFEVVSLISSG